MIDNEEILVRQTECLGMMHELRNDIRNLHHTLYGVKGDLSFTEARRYLNVSQTKLNELVRDKVIPCTRISPRRLVFCTDDLDEYLDFHRTDVKENGHV